MRTRPAPRRRMASSEIESRATIGIHLDPGQPRDALPGQQVGVMLERRDSHHVTGSPVEQSRRDVEALRGRSREHHSVVTRVGAHERSDHLARLLVDIRGQARLEARAAVDAGGPVEEPVHGVADRPERRGGRGLIEVRVAQAPAIGDRDGHVRAHPQVGHRESGSEGGWSWLDGDGGQRHARHATVARRALSSDSVGYNENYTIRAPPREAHHRLGPRDDEGGHDG